VKPVALITGASSGIGETFARLLAADGYRVILVARRRDRLEALASELSGEAICADLSTAEGRAAIVGRIQRDPLHLLVNNAGFGTLKRFWETDIEGQRQMHDLHVIATMELTHAALGGMVQRNEGAVINVASVAAFAQTPANVSYCSTKTWMLIFSETLSLELRLRGSNVQVQALCPGFTYSEFHDVLGVSRAPIAKSLWMSSAMVVRASLDGLRKRRPVVIPGWRYRLFYRLFFDSLVPANLIRQRSDLNRQRFVVRSDVINYLLN
jgi:uncharacterized protein